MYLCVLVGKEKALGPDHRSTLDTVNNLGILYQDQGKLAEAERMFVRALAGSERALGRTFCWDSLTSMGYLAALLSSQGKFEQAEEMQRQPLGLEETALGNEHPSTLEGIDNLASTVKSSLICKENNVCGRPDKPP